VKLADAILLSLSVAFFIMGIHQIMTVGFANGYWAIMISTILFFALAYRKGQSKKVPTSKKKK
jgi:hypothetical protein